MFALTLANAVVGLYSLNREPYQRDWFNGAIPMILQAKSDISAGFDGKFHYSAIAFGVAVWMKLWTEEAYGYFWSHNYKIINLTNNIIFGGEALIKQETRVIY